MSDILTNFRFRIAFFTDKVDNNTVNESNRREFIVSMIYVFEQWILFKVGNSETRGSR